ncbi:hypothetical protein ACYPKM_04610 [Pseudomonas aeruginosa]
MRTDVIVADAGPLRLLASVGKLDLLTQLGLVHVPDLIEIEATEYGEPNSSLIADWLRLGVSGSRAVIGRTSTGEALRLALLAKPGFRMGKSAVRAAIDWMLDTVDSAMDNVLIITDLKELANAASWHDAELQHSILSTPAMLDLCQSKGLISDT